MNIKREREGGWRAERERSPSRERSRFSVFSMVIPHATVQCHVSEVTASKERSNYLHLITTDISMYKPGNGDIKEVSKVAASREEHIKSAILFT